MHYNPFRALAPLLLLTLGLLTTFGSAPSVRPPGAIGPYLNGVFTAAVPGEGGRWDLEDVFPGQGFQGPLRIVPFPDAERGIVILGKRGQAWLADPVTGESRQIMDIGDRLQNGWEGGCSGIAFHPDFLGDHPEVFVFYRWREDVSEFSDEAAYQRLSRFRWNRATGSVVADSEEVMIQQYDRKSWHTGGDMFFGPEGFLYVGLGDEGLQGEERESNQRLDKGLMGGVLRIDVDNDPRRSHPIRRQPLPPDNPPEGWPATLSQGYSIPDDNPWLNSDGSQLEEFVVMGTRSPHAMSYDGPTQEIWIGDVGANRFEEINRAVIGDNLQWPYREGYARTNLLDRPGVPLGRERPPYLAYPHEVGASVMGGNVYRGERFPGLYGKYLFADWVANSLMAVDAAAADPELTTLIGDITALGTTLPRGAKVSGVFPQGNGDVFVTVMGSRRSDGPGNIYRLTQRDPVSDPPRWLSETGAFTDLSALSPAPGILPYRTNAQLYSDGALKQRWLSVPNDGDYDETGERVRFSGTDEWKFPEGTVFIKHFEMPVSEADPERTIRLETRFFVVGAGGVGYGVTYRWNDEGTDAYLLTGADRREFDFFDVNDNVVGSRTWNFPSRVQCLSCHTADAGYVLGLQTHQLNGTLTYPHSGQTMNQLSFLHETGLLNGPLGSIDDLPRAYALTDEDASLDLRVRSYLDANCASCHRPGGLGNVTMDLRFATTDPAARGLIGQPTRSHASDPDRLLVRPGDHAASELWVRDAAEGDNQMPPLGRTEIDDPWVALLAEWIDGLTTDDLPSGSDPTEAKVYPNPADNFVLVDFPNNWVSPFSVVAHDANGRRLYEKATNEGTFTLDLQRFPPGLLLLTLTDGAGDWTVRRVIRR